MDTYELPEPQRKKTKILLATTAGKQQFVCQPVSGMSETFGTAQEIPSFVGGMARRIDFVGPLPSSNRNRHNLVIGDHFTKWYEAIPLPDQTATTTANALVVHGISRFGCPHSLHSDQGRNFESKLFEQLMQLSEMDKTRTTPFHPQSNAVIERKNITLRKMLGKCINEERSNWSQQLPYAMMAYRSSVHESIGYTTQFLVCFGQELRLLLDFIYAKPQENHTSDIHESVHKKQQPFQPAFELARRILNEKRKRRNAIFSKNFHGPTYKEGQKVLLYHPAIAVRKTSKFASSWKGPYVIERCFERRHIQNQVRKFL